MKQQYMICQEKAHVSNFKSPPPPCFTFAERSKAQVVHLHFANNVLHM